MSDLVKRQKIIEIKGESYVLDEIPSESSGVVMAEKEKLLGVINLKALVDNLGRIGGFIRIAYNGVGAAGYEHIEEQIEIQTIGYGIAHLCNKSALTIAKFKKASGNIITHLQCTYGYLLENLDEMALKTLTNVAKVAAEMEKAALELNEDFEEQENKVIKTLVKTQKAKAIKGSKIQEEKEKRIRLEESIAYENELIKMHQEKEKEAEMRSRAIEQQEDKAISEIGSELPSIIPLMDYLTSAPTRIKIFHKENAEKRAEELRQNRLDALEIEKKIRQKQLEALASMSAFTAKLKQCKDDHEVAECAVLALHEVIGALKNLSAVMMQAALFWKKLQEHCHSLADTEIKELVEVALKLPEKKRLKVWTSDHFKYRAVQFYSSWVALNSVCAIYKKQIEGIQRDLHKYITENPTHEESMAMLPDLAENLIVDLKHDQQALERKNLKAQEEIQALDEAKKQ